MGLDPSEATSTIINEKNFVEDLSLTIGDLVDKKVSANSNGNEIENNIYDASLNFKLAVTPDPDSDDLLVHVEYTDVDGNEVSVVKRLSGENSEGRTYDTIEPDADGNYTITGLKLSENEDFNFDLRLEGTQVLDKGVYLYAPIGGRDTSQTMVGYAEGTHEVDVSMGVTIRFDVDEDDQLTVKRSWSKTPSKPNPPESPEDSQDPPIEIPDEEPPTTDIPEDEPTEIPDDDPPLVDIPEEDPPLADVPKTGDMNVLWLGMSTLLSGGGLAGLLGLGRKGKEKE